MNHREERTTVEKIMDNKRAVARLEEGGYDYSDVKLALGIVGFVIVLIFVIHFIATGAIW